MRRIEAGLIQKAMREPWEKLSFAFTLNLLTLVIFWFSGTLWLFFAVSLIVDVLVSLQALVQKARVKRFVQTLELNDSYPVCRQADNTFFLPKKLISWYNLLVACGITDFEDTAEAETTEEGKTEE